MPSLGLGLDITNLQKKNYNSIALEVWDIEKPLGSVTLNNFAIELKNDKATIQWGDNTQITSTSNTITASKIYT